MSTPNGVDERAAVWPLQEGGGISGGTRRGALARRIGLLLRQPFHELRNGPLAGGARQGHRVIGELGGPGAVERDRQSSAGEFLAGVDVAHQGADLSGVRGANEQEIAVGGWGSCHV